MKASAIKSCVRQKVEGFRRPECGKFGYVCPGRGTPGSLAASCDAVLCLYATGQLQAVQADFADWAEYINSFQDPGTGWFRDSGSAWVSADRLDPWIFGFALRALNALESQPAHPLRFLDEWNTPDAVRAWIGSGKDIMHMGIIWLKYGRECQPFEDFEDRFFQAIDETNRLYGSERSAFKRVAGKWPESSTNRILKDPFHNLFVYYAAERQIPHMETYIDWFLEEQSPDGFFFSTENAAPVYSHMDGLQLVVEFTLRSDYRSVECLRAVRKGLDAVVDSSDFEARWDVDLHQLLARCETIAQATRLLTDHPLAGSGWNPVWDLRMWKADPCGSGPCARNGSRQEDDPAAGDNG